MAGGDRILAGGWYLTYQVMSHSFEPIQIQGLTFSGPSAEWLMDVLHDGYGPWTFGLGLMPGVFLGSLAGALMGFGSMLAGGCAVG
jgi:hypothetical protein